MAQRDLVALVLPHIGHVVERTDLCLGKKVSGKVRDTYLLPDRVVLATTDRLSAFDRVLTCVPFKGQVLNELSAWWFDNIKDIVPTHVLSVPDANVMIAKRCTPFSVEVVVRGYITGTTDTSLWTHYNAGSRDYCGNKLPEGLKKNQILAAPLLTPTTKEDAHDRPISPADIVKEGRMSQADWDRVAALALAIFKRGQEVSAQRGLILVDTKYEFGRDATGNITLIDEVHTPDSSRYWIAATYEQRFAAGEEPENIDKEFVRLWYKSKCDPYRDVVLPTPPPELIAELSARYIRVYETITGRTFAFPTEASTEAAVTERILRNIQGVVPAKLPRRRVVLLTSVAPYGAKDLAGEKLNVSLQARQIEQSFVADGLPFETHVTSGAQRKTCDLLGRLALAGIPTLIVAVVGESDTYMHTLTCTSAPVIYSPVEGDSDWVNMLSGMVVSRVSDVLMCANNVLGLLDLVPKQ